MPKGKVSQSERILLTGLAKTINAALNPPDSPKTTFLLLKCDDLTANRLEIFYVSNGNLSETLEISEAAIEEFQKLVKQEKDKDRLRELLAKLLENPVESP